MTTPTPANIHTDANRIYVKRLAWLDAELAIDPAQVWELIGTVSRGYRMSDGLQVPTWVCAPLPLGAIFYANTKHEGVAALLKKKNLVAVPDTATIPDLLAGLTPQEGAR